MPGEPVVLERRRQVDRTATMRASLEDAAVTLLVEQGWASITAIEVCNRVGVSRGAFHHHYPSLASLLAAALRRVCAGMVSEPHPRVSDLVGLVDATWTAISDPRFKAVLEAWLAMANDPSLEQEIGPVVGDFSKLVDPSRVRSSTLSTDEDRALYLMARETMLGLALGRAVNRGEPLGHEQAVLAQLRRVVADHVAGISIRLRSEEMSKGSPR